MTTKNKTKKDFQGRYGFLKMVMELCKRLRLDNTVIWYMRKPEPVLENEKHNL